LTDNLEDVQERLHAGDPLVNPEIVFEARHKKDAKQKHVASLRNALAFGQTAPAPAPVSDAGRLRGFSTVPALTVRVDTSNVPSRRIVWVKMASISRRGPRHIHFDDSTNSASRPSAEPIERPPSDADADEFKDEELEEVDYDGDFMDEDLYPKSPASSPNEPSSLYHSEAEDNDSASQGRSLAPVRYDTLSIADLARLIGESNNESAARNFQLVELTRENVEHSRFKNETIKLTESVKKRIRFLESKLQSTLEDNDRLADQLDGPRPRSSSGDKCVSLPLPKLSGSHTKGALIINAWLPVFETWARPSF
jgi:hypothetical protein